MIVHHHFLYQAETGAIDLGYDPEKNLIKLLCDIVQLIDMKILIEPRVAKSKFNAWTGVVGIITSHIAFHYWVEEAYVQLDVYSCKEFDKEKLAAFLDRFWGASNTHTVFIERQPREQFKINVL